MLEQWLQYADTPADDMQVLQAALRNLAAARQAVASVAAAAPAAEAERLAPPPMPLPDSASEGAEVLWLQRSCL